MTTGFFLLLQVAMSAACIVWYARKHPAEFGQMVARARKLFAK